MHQDKTLFFTLQQLEMPEHLHHLCRELSALVPDRVEGPWSEQEVRELVQGWRMMAFCREDELVRAHPFHSADGLFCTVVFDTCPA
ncbi:hypothetical protein [Aquitalea magnusonii]|jgi:hypothetical protein|uniref:hypothetical protein n=1 Tax=Aquitalea magnusonii TaxID=332411 RepID=UPI000B5C8898|nr:hypothetical protein [Aquitalea magnusonii]